MASREEFLRAMGLTADDMANPDEVKGPAPPPRAATRTNSSLLSNREAKEPNLSQSKLGSSSNSTPAASLASAHRSATKTSSSGLFGGKSTSYADDEEDSYTAPSSNSFRTTSTRNATGSQEVSAAPEASSSAAPSYMATTAPASPPKKSRAELQKEAEEMKMEGNAAFQRQEYRKAIRCYSKAIEADPSNAALYSNRSAAYLAGASQTGMDTRSMALRDAVKASELKPDWPKGYCRQAEALIELERFMDAADAYRKALELDPQNDSFRQRMDECEAKAGPARSTPSAINNNISVDAPLRSQSSTSSLRRDGGSNSSFSSSTGMSAREMALRAAEENDTFRGADFREQQLEQMRQRRSGGSFSSSTTSVHSSSGFGSVSKARDVPPEYSTSAAKAYQQSLLEAYRKKKSQG